MDSEAKKYFRYLHLVRKDVREEFERLELDPRASRVCDFGCGSGIFTFGLALEMPGAECTGLDLFSGDLTPEVLGQYSNVVRRQCEGQRGPNNPFPPDLCRLVLEAGSPRFIRGDIVADRNLPSDVDLAYCKKLLVNLPEQGSEDGPAGEERLRVGLEHIAQSIRPGGLLCLIEYDREYGLAKHLDRGEFRILRRAQIVRREIRSPGRTSVISTFALYLCQRVEGEPR